MMKAVLLGFGRMGRMVERLAPAHGMEIVGVVEGTGAEEELLEKGDVWIDFSTAAATPGYVEKACQMEKQLVVGTTGWQMDGLKERVEGAGIGVLISPNFSLGVAIFTKLVERAGELLGEEYERAGVEWHHSAKVDAPSGTAKALGEILGVEFESVRCGKIPGTHTVVFDSAVDTIELTHRARSREGFANGALRGAKWLEGKKGLFTLDDLVATVVS